mmetsp:Transcript_4982/g.12514  ORF Transcript_4982/g.12514 Transcript_4982/m.12514 type:complete len:99 (-) Transcript_4982:1582-1878(-)
MSLPSRYSSEEMAEFGSEEKVEVTVIDRILKPLLPLPPTEPPSYLALNIGTLQRCHDWAMLPSQSEGLEDFLPLVIRPASLTPERCGIGHIRTIVVGR